MVLLEIKGEQIELDKATIEAIGQVKLKAFIKDVEARCPELTDWQWWEKLKAYHLKY